MTAASHNEPAPAARPKIAPRDRLIAWVDVEASHLRALDPRVLLLEVAVSLTTSDLQPIKSISVAIHHDPHTWANALWSQWAIDMHKQNGLWEACLKPAMSMKLAEAERQLCDFLDRHCGEPPAGCEPNLSPTAPFWGGCSTWIDRTLLMRCMPEVERRIYYRVIDSSCLSTAAQLWANWDRPDKESDPHRALWDSKAATRLARPIRDMFQNMAARARSREVAGVS